MTPTSSTSPAPVGHCPQCGYDQRGLPGGSMCPECGHRFLRGHAVGDINRWVDAALLKLWSIAVLQLVGLGSLILGYLSSRHTLPAGVMLIMVATVYIFAASTWYAVLLTACLRRAIRPIFKNVTPTRRVDLTRRLLTDAALSAASIALLIRLFANA